jgi:hypothetical protein
MPTTALTITESPNRYAGNDKVVAMVAADVANGNHFLVTNNAELLVFAHNAGASTRTITITSQPDATSGRLANVVAENILAGEYKTYRLAYTGWANPSDNKILISASHAEVKLGAVNLSAEVTT